MATQETLREDAGPTPSGDATAPQGRQQHANPVYHWLMGRAQGDTSDSHALACVISARANEADGDLAELLGLDTRSLCGILGKHFPGAVPDGRQHCLRLALQAAADQSFRCDHCGGTTGTGTASADPGATGCELPGMEEEYADIRDLLLDHAASDRPLATHLASILARTCLRGNHLWEDLGVRDRSEISALMRRNFPALAARNVDGRMRWKKFFYKQLCERAEISICRSPNCQSCDEYRVCFSPEQSGLERAEGLVWTQARVA